jgi:hypothetical protein
MKRIAMAAICLLIARPLAAQPAEQRLPWDSMPPLVEAALHAFRHTDHWVAEGMAENIDGDRQGRDHDAGRSYNFDPTRHLLFIQDDLNGDGRPEVFLLFDWPAVRGNQQAWGVVMVSDGPASWRIGCQISDWGNDGPQGGIRILERRSHGWRHFRTSDAIYGWRPVRGGRRSMECVAIASVLPPRRVGRAG